MTLLRSARTGSRLRDWNSPSVGLYSSRAEAKASWPTHASESADSRRRTGRQRKRGGGSCAGWRSSNQHKSYSEVAVERGSETAGGQSRLFNPQKLL